MIKKENIQTEVDVSYLYQILARHEKNDTIAPIFRKMSEIESGHALAFLKKTGDRELLPPSRHAKILALIGRVFGYNYVLGVLLDTEKSISLSIVNAKKEGIQQAASATRLMSPF